MYCDLMHDLLITNNISLLIYIFLLGTIIGSFLNTIIYRLPLMLGLVARTDNYKKFNLLIPRSHCKKCHSKIPFYLNIPIFSYLMLRGKCFNCKSVISLEYPLIEVLTGLALVWLALFMILSYELIFMSILSCTLIVLAIIDLKHLVLPNSITYSLIFLGLLINLLFSMTPFLYACLGCCLGYLLFFIIEKLFYLIKKEDGLGRGDAKLIAAIGSWVGLDYLPFIILIAACLGILFFIIVMIINKKSLNQSLNLQIPFGTFLAISCIAIIPLINY